jgi:heat shock protein HslJ
MTTLCDMFVMIVCGTLLFGAASPAAGGTPRARLAQGEAMAPKTAQAASLAGTRWRLVEIQSMDDAVGTTKPEHPKLYTMAFHTDGSVVMRLHCNRGRGSWSVTPGSTDMGGSIRIGKLAVTRALCPPPSLDERIARDMDYVRSYTLKDGKLYLSLMADGGIYVWEAEPE